MIDITISDNLTVAEFRGTSRAYSTLEGFDGMVVLSGHVSLTCPYCRKWHRKFINGPFARTGQGEHVCEACDRGFPVIWHVPCEETEKRGER